MKGNVINLNTLHLNSVRLNGIGKVQSVSLKGGSTEDPVFPPIEPPIEPEPTPTYTLSASVTNGMVSATRNGSAVNLPFTANEGDTIVLEVTPNDGYAFEGWADGNTDNPRTITMTADVALSAQCVEVVQPPVGNYIQFEDKAVEAICVENWSSDGIGLTEEDAAKVTTIGTTFKGNTEITSFNELRHFTRVTSLVSQAFYGCKSLRSINLSFVKKLNGYAIFADTPLECVVLGDLIYIGEAVFKNCSAASFMGGLPQTITTISVGYNFYNCENLTGALVLPNVANIPANCFLNTGIERVLDLGATQTLGGSAFEKCTKLSVAILPYGTSKMTYNTFNGCSSLNTIICKASVPPSISEGNNFRGTPIEAGNGYIYVPNASLEAYKTATNWNAYADRIKGISDFATDNPTLYAEIEEYL